MTKRLSVDVQSVIDAQDNPLVLIDRDYRIIAANTAYQLAYGVNTGDVVERTLFRKLNQYGLQHIGRRG
jgi:transcriptional regulator with PAS, ATPase and Fis domain